MRRRAFLAAAAALAAPRGGRGDAVRVLRFLPRADPGGLDPVADPRPEVADAALLVWDTLYGVDSRLEPQLQMCAGQEASDDRLIWTFHLRPGLSFHDGMPVRAADAVASLWRWMARDRMGGAIRDRLDALEALDDTSFRLRLRAPFAPLLYALGKPNPPLAVVMPERLARTDPAVPVPQIIGSGPLRLLADAWRPGSRVVFERFDGYGLRGEAADWLAGGKRVLFDRIEWSILPDPAQAAEMLQNGDADWWAAPDSDLVPVLKRNRNLLVDTADPLGRVGIVRLNCAQPPFDDARVRHAVRKLISQDACMSAMTGGDDALWRRMDSVFTPGTRAAAAAAGSQGGGEVAGADDPDEARGAMARSGSGGGRLVVIAPVDPGARAQAQVVAAALQRLGLAVEVQALAPAALASRAARPEGWNALAASVDGAEAATPANAVLAGNDASPLAAAEADWYGAATGEAAATACAAVNRLALAKATCIPTGQFLRYQAWRTDLSGVGRGPLPLVWGVQRT
jgi:peptide/nickel transport system substrate-binding protein